MDFYRATGFGDDYGRFRNFRITKVSVFDEFEGFEELKRLNF